MPSSRYPWCHHRGCTMRPEPAWVGELVATAHCLTSWSSVFRYIGMGHGTIFHAANVCAGAGALEALRTLTAQPGDAAARAAGTTAPPASDRVASSKATVARPHKRATHRCIIHTHLSPLYNQAHANRKPGCQRLRRSFGCVPAHAGSVPGAATSVHRASYEFAPSVLCSQPSRQARPWSSGLRRLPPGDRSPRAGGDPGGAGAARARWYNTRWVPALCAPCRTRSRRPSGAQPVARTAPAQRLGATAHVPPLRAGDGVWGVRSTQAIRARMPWAAEDACGL